MPPTTRSQAVRETLATSNSPPLHLQHPPSSSTTTTKPTATTITPQFITNDLTYRPPRTVPPDEPLTFTIDLSQPAEHRYDAVCAALRPELRALPVLFDEVVAPITRVIPATLLKFFCRLILRGVRDREECAELRGIGRATGVPLYLLVCLNVLLDLFMGCSSGGAVVRESGPEREEGEEEEGEGDEELGDGKGQDGDEERGIGKERKERKGGGKGSKMVHFRTLDWGMPALRKVVVRLDFVAETDGPVIATSITYAGFVGVLTGVRKGFSVSLNFRPQRHNKGKFGSDLRYYWHLFMVLLGWRRSIASELRGMLLPRRAEKKGRSTTEGALRFWSYEEIVPRPEASNEKVTICGKRMTSTACYLCFCNGDETTVLEKDRVTAVVRRSRDFIVVTNHDEGSEADGHTVTPESVDESPFASALTELVHDAEDRKQCAEHNYHNLRARKAKRRGTALRRVMEVDDIVQLVQKYPTTNESTHFACVMDPKQGSMRWCRRWKRPITSKWMREHQSETW